MWGDLVKGGEGWRGDVERGLGVGGKGVERGWAEVGIRVESDVCRVLRNINILITIHRIS